jgi:phosphoglycolate phosphatase-like HAD superfamily hydrolase
MNYKEIYDYLDENYETTISKDEYVDIFDEVAQDIYHNRVELLDGFHEIREELAERGVPVAIVTSSPPSWHCSLPSRPHSPSSAGRTRTSAA